MSEPLHLLFWLSLVPFVTAWMGASGFAPQPTALYGVVLFRSGGGFWILTHSIMAAGDPTSALSQAIGNDRKGLISLVVYVIAIVAALVSPLLAFGLYILVQPVWLVPNPRIERALEARL